MARPQNSGSVQGPAGRCAAVRLLGSPAAEGWLTILCRRPPKDARLEECILSGSLHNSRVLCYHVRFGVIISAETNVGFFSFVCPTAKRFEVEHRQEGKRAAFLVRTVSQCQTPVLHERIECSANGSEKL